MNEIKRMKLYKSDVKINLILECPAKSNTYDCIKEHKKKLKNANCDFNLIENDKKNSRVGYYSENCYELNEEKSCKKNYVLSEDIPKICVKNENNKNESKVQSSDGNTLKSFSRELKVPAESIRSLYQFSSNNVLKISQYFAIKVPASFN